jgi:hypothetical protein
MNKKLKSSHSIVIHASKEQVWDIMTNPEKNALYLYGTKTQTDWKIGSPILFTGTYNEMTYSDKGLVMANVPYSLLAYDYWSQFSGLEDIPENYCEVSYHIEYNHDGSVTFTWQQIGFKDEASLEHNQTGMPALLEEIKKLAESQ